MGENVVVPAWFTIIAGDSRPRSYFKLKDMAEAPSVCAPHSRWKLPIAFGTLRSCLV